MGTKEPYDPLTVLPKPLSRPLSWDYDLEAQIAADRKLALDAFGAELIGPRIEAVCAVIDERNYQDEKHGPIGTHGHTIGEWILIMEAELAEAKQALIKGGKGRDSVLHELVQVTAVGLACLEQHGVKEITGRSV